MIHLAIECLTGSLLPAATQDVASCPTCSSIGRQQHHMLSGSVWQERQSPLLCSRCVDELSLHAAHDGRQQSQHALIAANIGLCDYARAQCCEQQHAAMQLHQRSYTSHASARPSTLSPPPRSAAALNSAVCHSSCDLTVPDHCMSQHLHTITDNDVAVALPYPRDPLLPSTHLRYTRCSTGP